MDKKQLELMIQLFQKLQNEISTVKATNQLLLKKIALKEGESLQELQQSIDGIVRSQVEHDQKRFYDFVTKKIEEQDKSRLYPLK